MLFVGCVKNVNPDAKSNKEEIAFLMSLRWRCAPSPFGFAQGRLCGSKVRKSFVRYPALSQSTVLNARRTCTDWASLFCPAGAGASSVQVFFPTQAFFMGVLRLRPLEISSQRARSWRDGVEVPRS